MRFVARVGLVAAMAVATASSAAPKKPAPAPASEARRHFDEGLKAFRAKRYDRAIAELEIANAFDPQPGTLRMLAFAYKESKRFVEAHAAYDKLRAAHWDRLSAADQGDVMLMLSMLEHLTAQIELHCDERGAEVSFDGERVGVTPFKAPVRVTAGPHRVRATLPGSEAIQYDVRLEPKQKLTLTFKFVSELGSMKVEVKAFPTGKLFVDADPADARVFLDGKDVAAGQVEAELKIGRHRVEVAAPGHRSFLEDVLIEDGKTATKTVRLERVGAAPTEAAAPPPQGGWEGFYGMATLVGAMGAMGGKILPCPEGGTCVGQQPIAGALAVRLGHSFGNFGLEGVAAFLGETHPERQSVVGAEAPGEPGFEDGVITREQAFRLYSIGGFAGAGVRATTQDPMVRLSFGAAPGVALRRHALRREVTGALRDTYVATASTVSGSVLFDATVLVGGSPGGARFTAGVLVWLDFPGAVNTPSGDPRIVPFQTEEAAVDATLPTPPYPVVNGPQFFVGPAFGLHWGR